MQHNVDAWQIIRVPNRYLSQGLANTQIVVTEYQTQGVPKQADI